MDIILGNADFHVTSSKRNPPDRDKAADAGEEPFHIFNTLAGVCKGLRNTVEAHCSRSLVESNVTPVAQDKIDASTSHKTMRGQWLRFVGDSCAFCNTSSAGIRMQAAVAEQSLGQEYRTMQPLQETGYAQARSKMHYRRMQVLAGSPFDPDILCCGLFEFKHWPKQITFDDAMQNYGIPECSLLWPITRLSVGRRQRSYRAEQTAMRTQQISDTDTTDALSIFQVAARLPAGLLIEWHISNGPLVLQDEVEMLRDAIVAGGEAALPMWMNELPGCMQSSQLVQNGGQGEDDDDQW